ncbi:purine-nucleoside phosphorylase [Paenibacillus aurantius]|uniref:purine-nucleoside phosphorylase n=2 Tax=Paenibacillus aurantius TaxID=2918900 RepID=A0AA96LJ44_9BACL|nr:purine-nucleoside phosphorylase [Paenibacillus aurantius]WNQ14273.1 purine-nucleoside phosphorylase [Paenibacillus aurantius]
MGEAPAVGLILGSGLGVLADLLEGAVSIPYGEIPHFPVPTVEGHAGELVFGRVAGTPVVMMKGRFHLYEGHAEETVSFPVRVMQSLGIRTLVVTNAAGGVNEEYRVGDIMLLRDHINFMFRSPLIGPNPAELGVRFPDMSEAYSARLRQVAKAAAKNQGLQLREGVYLAVTGPNYETPAEIRMMRRLGADAVGMSTVPEVLAARHAGLEVIGFSCITNAASGIGEGPLSHEEVMEAAEQAKQTFLDLVMALIPQLQEETP